MVTFKRNQPITTRAPRIPVDAGLPPGRYQFSLTVVDAAGNPSRPSLHTVQVLPEGRIDIEIERPRIDIDIERPRIDIDRPDIDIERPRIDIPDISRIDPGTDPRLDPRINPRIRGRRNRNNSLRNRLRRFLDRNDTS